MHKIFMANVPDDTNQGTSSKGDSFDFSLFGNIGVPLMVTLYIPGLNVELPVWLGTIPNVPNDLDASHLRTLCHGNHVDVPSSTKSSPPPSTFSGESIDTSNWKSKRNINRNNRKKKSPTFVSHVRDRSSTSVSHVEDQQLASAIHAGGMNLVPVSHTGVQSPTSISHVGYCSSASPSHVGDSSSTSASHVEYQHPTSTSHAGGKSPVIASHIGDRSVASMSHVINQSPTSASHVGDVQPTIDGHARGIDSVDKTRWIGHKPKFPCKICKGDHLTHLCLGIPEVQRLWSLSANAYDSKSFEVSSQHIHPWLMKWSCRCNLRLIPLLFLGVMVCRTCCITTYSSSG
jgi:hypothetical protein